MRCFSYFLEKSGKVWISDKFVLFDLEKSAKITSKVLFPAIQDTQFSKFSTSATTMGGGLREILGTSMSCTKTLIEFLEKQYQNQVMFWKTNMLFEPEFLEKSGKMEFQDHYQPCHDSPKKSTFQCWITGLPEKLLPVIQLDYWKNERILNPAIGNLYGNSSIE